MCHRRAARRGDSGTPYATLADARYPADVVCLLAKGAAREEKSALAGRGPIVPVQWTGGELT